MRELSLQEMQQIEGGEINWLDLLKGAACAGLVVGAVNFGGPASVVLAFRIGAGAGCLALLFA